MKLDRREPLWLYPNLLGLDTPLVAMAWLFVFAKTWRVDYLPWPAYAALGLAVWIAVTVDRLLARMMSRNTGAGQEARQPLLDAHAKVFAIAAAAGSVVLLGMMLTVLPMSIFNYLRVGGVLVVGCFVLAVLGGGRPDEPDLAKRAMAGAALAFGTAMVAHAFLPAIELMDMLRSREFLTFAVLCVLQMCALDHWRGSARRGTGEEDPAGDFAMTLPVVLLAVAALTFAVMSQQITAEPFISARPFFIAILTGAALLYVVNRNRGRFEEAQLRMLANGVLAAPVLVFVALTAG